MMKGNDSDDFYLIECPLLSSPITVFEHHLVSSSLVTDTAPLFTWKTADGGWCPMMKNWFMGRCRAIWEKEGLDLLDGHGFWI